MNTVSQEICFKDLSQKNEDAIEDLMFNESFYEDVVDDWLENMRRW
ncbi:hypothetical protein ACFL5G_05690 [Candidatus Margulisiibacteriota bacterium]